MGSLRCTKWLLRLRLLSHVGAPGSRQRGSNGRYLCPSGERGLRHGGE